MTKQYLKGSVKTEKGKGTFSVIASTADVDRQGESIDQAGWDLTNYLNNPVILWAHDYSALPIGLAEDISVTEKGLTMSGRFASIEANPMADMVRRLYEDGILKTVSVGFIPHEREGNLITKSELLEVSFVPVPANPNALSLAMTKGLKIEPALVELIEKCVEIDLTEPKEETPPEETPAEEPKPEEEEKPKQESTEVQSVILAKEYFPTEEEASNWVVDHGFVNDKVDETEDSWRFRQFEPEMCGEDSFRTIAITDGVDAVICIPKDGKTCGVKVFDNTDKSGRVISRKNRELLNNAISSMKESVAYLEDLLSATEEPKKTIDDMEVGEVKKSEVDNGLVEIPVELLKEILSQTRSADRQLELSNAVLKRILNKVN